MYLNRLFEPLEWELLPNAYSLPDESMLYIKVRHQKEYLLPRVWKAITGIVVERQNQTNTLNEKQAEQCLDSTSPFNNCV